MGGLVVEGWIGVLMGAGLSVDGVEGPREGSRGFFLSGMVREERLFRSYVCLNRGVNFGEAFREFCSGDAVANWELWLS